MPEFEEEEELLEEEEEGQASEMYEHHRIEADNGQNLLRVDKFLMSRLPNASRTKIQEAADAGNILVNGKAVKSSYKVKPKDIVSVVMAYPRREIEIIPENIPLNIVYEDDDLMVVNKPAGMVVHPSYGHYTGTLVNALAWQHVAERQRRVLLASRLLAIDARLERVDGVQQLIIQHMQDYSPLLAGLQPKSRDFH